MQVTQGHHDLNKKNRGPGATAVSPANFGLAFNDSDQTHASHVLLWVFHWAWGRHPPSWWSNWVLGRLHDDVPGWFPPIVQDLPHSKTSHKAAQDALVAREMCPAKFPAVLPTDPLVGVRFEVVRSARVRRTVSLWTSVRVERNSIWN